MRILLAAANAGKGDLDANLAKHLAALEVARAQGAGLLERRAAASLQALLARA